MSRKREQDEAGKAWFELRDHARKLGINVPPLSKEEIQESTRARMAMKHPTNVDQALLLDCFIAKGIP